MTSAAASSVPAKSIVETAVASASATAVAAPAAMPDDAKTDAQTIDSLLALYHVVILRAYMAHGKRIRPLNAIRLLKRNTDTRSDDVASKGTGVYLTLAEALLSVAAANA